MQLDITYLDHVDHFRVSITDGHAPGDHVFEVERGDLETLAAALRAAVDCNSWDDEWAMSIKTEQSARTTFADPPIVR